jgi:hypothetical protein
MKHFLRPTLTAAALAVALGITAGAQAQTSSSAAAPVANKAQASQILGYQMVVPSLASSARMWTRPLWARLSRPH